jgi:hypothetical protein
MSDEGAALATNVTVALDYCVTTFDVLIIGKLACLVTKRMQQHKFLCLHEKKGRPSLFKALEVDGWQVSCSGMLSEVNLAVALCFLSQPEAPHIL